MSDDKQRKLYDQFGHAGVDPNFQASENPFAGFEGFNFGDGSFHFSSNSEEIDPEDLFDMFFGGGGGGGRRRRGPRRGADLQMHVRIPFEEAVFGTKRDLNVKYQHVNRKTGEVSVKERQVTVDIPAGVDTGMNLRLSGQGAEGEPGAPAGNLLVQIVVDPHDYFVRDGENIHTEVPIDFVTAILGGTVDVRTLNGTVEMKIPKGCQPETKMLLRGKGIRGVHGSGVGNQIVHIKVEIPKYITTRQEELLRKFNGEDVDEKKEKDRKSGLGKAAENAFEKIFGSKKEGGKGDEKTNEDYDGEEDKKRAAS